MKRLLAILALLPSLAHAATINVNSTMSEATIQGLINGGNPGDTVSFAGGTYNLASNGSNPNGAAFNLKAGLFYTGPTSGSPAHLVGAGCGSGCAYPLMYFSGTTVNIQYLAFDNGILFLEDHTTSATIDNNAFINIDCGTVASQVTAVFVAGGINNSDISNNTFSNIGSTCFTHSDDSKGAGGITFYAFHNVTVNHNTFTNVHEAIDIPDSGGGGYDGAGSQFNYNTGTGIHRIFIELLGTSTIPSGLEVAFNNYSNPLNPYFASMCLSLTAGQNMISHDNFCNGNVSSPPYGIEIAGVGTRAYNNTVEGYFQSGFAIGNTLGPISITNNNICGPTMNSAPGSGSTPSVGNANGFISWEGSSQGGTFTGNTTSGSLTCAATPPVVATPTFSPAAGTYAGPQTVTISTATGGASIVYTNDGTTPTVAALTCTVTHGTLYSGPVSVATSQTLKAIGCLATNTASSAASAAYFISEIMAWKLPRTGTNFTVIPSEFRRFFLNQQHYSAAGANYTLVDGSTTYTCAGATGTIAVTGASPASAQIVACNNAWVDTVAHTSGSTGVVTLTNPTTNTYAFTSTTHFSLKATATDGSGLSATQTVYVLNPTVTAKNMPSQRMGVYINQPVLISSTVEGSVVKTGTWSITTNPGSAGHLGDTTLRDTVFTATAAGRYVLTFTATAGPTATTIIDIPDSTAYPGMTSDGTEPFNCAVDSNLTGRTLNIGTGQTYADFAGLPFPLGPGDQIRLVQSASGTPDVIHSALEITSAGTQSQPIVICGVPNVAGVRMTDDMNNAVYANPTSEYVEGSAAFVAFAHSTLTNYITTAGFTIANANANFNYQSSVTGSLQTYQWGTAPATPSSHTNFAGGFAFYNFVDNSYQESSDDSVIGMRCNACGVPLYSKADYWLEEGNNFPGWGVWNPANAGSPAIHGTYMNGRNGVAQFNTIGPASSSLAQNGGMFKSRSMGTELYRYNYLNGNDGGASARAFDLVENQDICTVAPEQYWAPDCEGSFNDVTYNNFVSLDTLAAHNEARHTQVFTYGNLSTNLALSNVYHYSGDQNLQPVNGGQAFMPRVGSQWLYANTHIQLTGSGAFNGNINCADMNNNALDGSEEYPSQTFYGDICYNNATPTHTVAYGQPRALIMTAVSLWVPSSIGANNQTSGGGAWPSADTSQSPLYYSDYNNLPQHVFGFGTSGSTLPNLATSSPVNGSYVTQAGYTGTALPANMGAFPVRYNSVIAGLFIPRSTPVTSSNGGLAGAIDATVGVVSDPSCTPPPGGYSTPQTVSCSSATPGATICGTTDGSTPTSTTPGTCLHGTSGPFTVTTSLSIKVLATKSGLTNSNVATVPYTIIPNAPTNFSGQLGGLTNVTIP